MIFVDTNYFLRFLLKDNDEQFREAKQIFLEAAKGKASLFTSLIVFFELYWVLKSFYQKDKESLTLLLNNILHLSFIEFEERELFLESLSFYKISSFSLEDCYNLAYAHSRQATDFKTFDRKLQKGFK